MALRNLATRKSSVADQSTLLTEAIYSWQMTSANTVTSVEPMGSPETEALCALLDAGRIALVEVNGKRQVSRWSAAAERIFGWREGEIIRRSIALLAANKNLEDCLVTVSDHGVSQCEVLCRAKNGAILPVEIWALRIRGENRRVLLAISDASESQFLEHAFLDAADREQRRIGKEMHDHLCQQILGAAFAVKALAGDLDREGSRHAEQLHELARMVNETVSQVRDISRTLHPVELESGELQSAIQGLADRIKHALPCEFHCLGEVPRPNAQSALHAYRIVHETILHALHHTGATKVSIRLSAKGDSLRIEIFDNGTKEGPLTADVNHIASKTLRYRAKAIRGQLRLKFHSGVGTSVGCTFPQTS
jgi:PAS domain S-box-containing protein